MVLCVTAMNSISYGPISTRRPGRTSRRVVESSRAGFFEAFFDERKGEASAVNGDVEIAEDVGEGADVIFVAVRENDGADVLAILLEIGDVGNDEVDAEKLGFGEHHAGVNDENVVTETKHHHVHAEFAETAERDRCEGLRRLTQKRLSP